MPSLLVNDNSTEFFYTDSGKPADDVYTTLVIIHGHTFHSGTFQRLLPLAASKGLRLICLNRRDYAPTTLFSAAELKVLSEGSETERTAFMQSRGIEVALFLNRLIDELSLPAPTSSGNGGLGLLGWSLGNAVSLATIAAASSLSTEVRQRLQLYLRRLILLEPPSVALGMENPSEHYVPLNDETIPEQERGAAFAQWVASYYKHPDLSIRDTSKLNHRHADPSKKPSIANMSPEEFGSVVDFAPGQRSDIFLISSFGRQFAQQTSKALFDPATRALWPRLDIWYVYGDASTWNIISPVWHVEEQAKSSGDQTVKFKRIDGANHFVFWDEPERTMDILAHCLQT